MAVEGTPCPVCGAALRALATSTYCPAEALHNNAAPVDWNERTTEELDAAGPPCAYCKSTNTAYTGPMTMFGGAWHKCLDCNLQFIP